MKSRPGTLIACPCCEGPYFNPSDHPQTMIGKATVPVLGDKARTTVRFSAGAHGKRERGLYHFWTAVGRSSRGMWQITGRARARLSPGDRFDRMKDERLTATSPATRRAYARMYRLAQSASYVRPATAFEVRNWIHSHRSDAKHITPGVVIEGRKLKRVP